MKKILSLDGGGIKGTFTASFLAELEDGIGGKVGEYFDLIAGTSTGGIIAIGLGMGLSAREMLDLYEREGERIFAGNWMKWPRWAIRTKYDSEGLRSVLEERLGDRRLWESRTRLLIPAQQLESGDVHIFKTPHHTDYQRDWRQLAVDVALATSAAPTYFAPARAPRGSELIDGGLWANNPVAVACAEAGGHRLGWGLEEIKVLSIGCTSAPMRRSFFRARGLNGVIGWIKPVLEIVAEGQSRGAVGQAVNLLGPQNVHRIDPAVARGRYKLDGIAGVPSLIGLGADTARHRGKDVLEAFFGSRVEPYQPCYWE